MIFKFEIYGDARLWFSFACCVLMSVFFVPAANAQSWSGNEIAFNHIVFGDNTDYTAFYRADAIPDNVELRLMLGDDAQGLFDVGYRSGQSTWKSLIAFDLAGVVRMARSGYEKKRIDFGAYSFIESRNVGGDATNANSYGTAFLRNAFVSDHGTNTYTNPNGYLQSQRIEMRAGNWYFDYRPGQNGTIGTWNESSWTSRLHIDGNNGRVGINTLEPDEALTVKGKIHTSEVRIDLGTNVVPDYVFEKDYTLLPLSEVESYIKANKHLPEVPSAKEMEADGMNLKEMNLILLKKVEELTLHLINVERVNRDQAQQIDDLQKSNLRTESSRKYRRRKL